MKHHLSKVCLALVAGVFAQQASASGYHFGTQSVGAQSTANAAAAEAADASTIFYNPAGLTKLQGRGEFTAAANIVMPSIKYSDAKMTTFRGAPATGITSGKIAETTIAPHLYGAYQLNNRVSLGLGMYIPFGSKTEYTKDSVLRYNINKLGLTSVALEPVVAFKANEKHSFGVGLIAQYSQAELRKYSDWSASGKLGDLPSGAADGHADVKGHDWGFGYHLGWMYDMNDRVRIGVNYRSKVEHNLSGSAKWQPDGAVAKAYYDNVISPVSGYVPNEKTSVKIVTPESLSVHGMYRASDKLNLYGDVTWTRHSRFDKAALAFEHNKIVAKTGKPDASGKIIGKSNTTVITPNWRDTYKVAIGGSYQYSEPLQLRAGIAYDQSPVKSSADRLNSMPDANRLWLSVGARYTHKKRHVFDVAYSYIDIKDSDYTAPAATGDSMDSRGASSAKFKTSASIVGLQYTYKF
ncbi:OmpP1/FadL family transporter [Kingella negevensis]|uniref:OmpP1/FadL family transporter n=1 Tax=Kingella negevensis TaxID=1522312 RepID=UPI002543B578|nr:OmpP1/FadL family transporter [Kingella negevensis]WII93926.1 OmpP1/FadL family transporter [Kingella negevensis]